MERFRGQSAGSGRVCGRFLFRIAGVIAFLIAGTARPAAPQAIQGRLLSQTTGGPVDAAIVSVFLGQERIARTLSDREGGFTLDVPGKGTYRIVAERIGFATDTSAVIEVGADAIIEFEFVLNERAVALDGIDVAATRRCEMAAGEGVSQLWDEIRKALDAASITSEGEYYHYGVMRSERERNVRTFAVESEAMRCRTILSSSPFRSAPAERLARTGYAQEARDDSSMNSSTSTTLPASRSIGSGGSTPAIQRRGQYVRGARHLEPALLNMEAETGRKRERGSGLSP
jgi:hypothetical protein